VEQLVARLLPAADRQTLGMSVRVRDQSTLAADERWGRLLRAPDVFLRRSSRPVAALGDWATVQRGFTTGANDFFYLDRKRVDQWGIEATYRRPLLKSLRGARALQLGPADCDHELLSIPPTARLAGTAVTEYLAWGEATGVNQRRTLAGRHPWYALPEQQPGDLLLAKGIWRRHFAPVVEKSVAVDQQLYRILPAGDVSPGVMAALLNSAWFALACEMQGRVNLGEGVLGLATYELSEIVLPDPRKFDAGERQALDDSFRRLAAHPVVETPVDLDREERRALDDLVFDLAGLPPAERAAAREALVDCLAGRVQRARRTGKTGGI
jgi:hypothetical protein